MPHPPVSVVGAVLRVRGLCPPAGGVPFMGRTRRADFLSALFFYLFLYLYFFFYLYIYIRKIHSNCTRTCKGPLFFSLS